MVKIQKQAERKRKKISQQVSQTPAADIIKEAEKGHPVALLAKAR